MNIKKQNEELIFKSAINLMVIGLIENDHDLEDILYYLKDLVGDYEEEFEKHLEIDEDVAGSHQNGER